VLAGLTPTAIEQFGGMVTLADALDVAVGSSPNSQNVEHLPGIVRSRKGLSTFLTVPGNANIVSMKEFAQLDQATRWLIILTSGGLLVRENGDGSQTQIQTGLGGVTRAQQQTQFGRQYLALSDGKVGNTPPFYLDSVPNLLRVAPSGPARAPTAAAGAAGNVSTGRHYLRTIYEFADGYRSAPGPAVAYDAPAPNAKISVSQVDVGPPACVRRIICCSSVIAASIPASGADYYFLPESAMVVNDNTTTGPVVIDFTDAQLQAGVIVSSQVESSTDLMRNIVLPEQAGVVAYNTRLLWWGGINALYRNGDVGFLGLDFDSDFHIEAGSRQVPNGWISYTDGCQYWYNPFGGGVLGAMAGFFRIYADGATQRGTISNNVQGASIQDVLRPGVAYGVRIRARDCFHGLAGGTYNFYLTSVAAGAASIPAGGFQLSYSQLTANWQEFSGQFWAGTQPIPADAVLVSTGGSGANGSSVLTPATQCLDIDSIEIYPMAAATTPSLVYASRPGQPAAYDGLRGLVSVAENDGQALRSVFVIRGTAYGVKERSMYSITDNGQDPIDWPVNPVSETVGTPSLNGVASGEGWAVIAARSGAYLFTGGFPIKISEGIQPTWDRINWAYGHLINCTVDTEQKRVFIEVPLDGATDVSHCIYLDYIGPHPGGSGFAEGLSGDPTPTSNWSIWTIAAASIAKSQRSDGTQALLFGTNNGSGKIYKLDKTARTDDGAAINAFYETAFVGGPSGRNIVESLTANVRGSGVLSMVAIQTDMVTTVPLLSAVLQNPPNKDVEWNGIRVVGERAAFLFGVNAPGDWFSMQKLVPYNRPHVFGRTRGIQT
jgi:hypothetical protein